MASSNGDEESALAASEEAAPAGSVEGLAIPPMGISGLVVTKADLIAALRIYVPLLADIAPLDGERFVLSMAPIIETKNRE